MSLCHCPPCKPHVRYSWTCPVHGHMVKPRIYVAGSSSERLTVVRPMILRLRGVGCVLTHDWTVCPGYDRPGTQSELREWARGDLLGVQAADIVWVMMPEAPSEGATGELCAALVLNKTVFVSGPHATRAGRIFPLLASRVCENHEDAFRVISRIG